ncbi:hypothetical protein ACWIG4_29750 [Streptomyces sp. NPDC002248]
MTVVDAFNGRRPRSLARSSLHPDDYRVGRRSGYVAMPERDFVAGLLDTVLVKHLGDEDAVYGVVHSVRAHGADWRGGGYAVLAEDYARIGPVCVRALNRAGYGAERFTGGAGGVRLRAPLPPRRGAAAVPRAGDPPAQGVDWEPWACDLAREHEPPHYNALMRYPWVDDAPPKPREA